MRTGPFAPRSHTCTGQALATLRITMLADAWPFKEFVQGPFEANLPGSCVGCDNFTAL